MKILRLKATFGQLENAELALQEGLSILELPNEGGKSTWCAFIQAMLYGIDTGAREKKGVKPDKVKYAPWSGSLMAGEMDILWGEKAVTIRRWSRNASGPMREFAAVYTGTEEPVPGLTAATVGETLTGASREVFARSAFIRQGGMAVGSSPELERRIAALVSTGEESASYTEADAQLRSWLRKRRFNKHGALPETEEKLRTVQEKLDALRDSEAELTRLETELEAAEARQKALTPQVSAARARERREALNRLTKNKRELRAAEQRYAAACQAEERLGEKRDAFIFAGKTPEAARQEAADAAAEALRLEAAAAKKGSPVPGWICLALAAAALLLALGWPMPFPLQVGLVAVGGAAALAAAVLFFLWRRAAGAAAAAAAERTGILQHYGVAEADLISVLAESYARSCLDWESARRERTQAAAALEAQQAQQAQQDEALLGDLDFAGGTGEAARLGRELSAVQGRAAALREDLARLRGRFATLGDPMVLKTELGSLEERRRTLQAQYDALELAIATLAEANGEIQTRFSPRLSALASSYMEALTGGRYRALRFDRDFSATAQRLEDTVPRESAFFSTGTLDQAYLALRLSVCDLALGTGDCPLILDDALVNFDDERLACALRVLADTAQRRQVLLFTCSGRERACLQALGLGEQKQ